jgi:hypothetical protein
MRLGVAMLVGCATYVPFCMLLDVSQRGNDWGYGPRYLMVLVVPLAVGSAVALASLSSVALRRRGVPRASRALALLSLVAAALAAVWVAVARPEWATARSDATAHAALLQSIEDARLDHAIVLAEDDTTPFDARDLTTNLPVDLYPRQPVLIATARGDVEDAATCLRQAYPDRRLYRASGSDDVKIEPFVDSP